MVTKREILVMLLKKLEQREPVLIVGVDDDRIPTIHNFYPKEYWESIEHHGWGFFEGKTEHGTFSFDGGGAMVHYNFEGGGWLSWSPLRVQNHEVLQDLGYNFERTMKALEDAISKLP